LATQVAVETVRCAIADGSIVEAVRFVGFSDEDLANTRVLSISLPARIGEGWLG
jgi:hypothetical protein